MPRCRDTAWPATGQAVVFGRAPWDGSDWSVFVEIQPISRRTGTRYARPSSIFSTVQVIVRVSPGGQ
jgi:hypothetical protein